MSVDGIEIAGLTLTIIAIAAIFIFMCQNNFPAFIFAENNWIQVETSESLGPETANFMWKHRSLDLITQAFVLFGTAAGCLAILRSKEGERNH